MTGLCLSRRTVLCTPHAHSCFSLVRSFASPYRSDISCSTPLHLHVFDLELANILDAHNQGIATGVRTGVFACTSHSASSVLRVQRTAFTATTASVETVSK